MVSREEVRDGPAGRGSRPRRELLTGAAAAALGVIAAETVAGVTPAEATQGQPVILGQSNTGATAVTGLAAASGPSVNLADPVNGIGILGFGGSRAPGVRGVAGSGSATGVEGIPGDTLSTGVSGTGGTGGGTGVVGTGGGSTGVGVIGVGGTSGTGVIGRGGGTGIGVTGSGGASNGTGVQGSGGGKTGIGVLGTASAGSGVLGQATAGGVGVLAENIAGGTAFQALGPAVFSRSGLLTISAGKSSGTVTGVPLTTASLVLATMQQNLTSIYVRAAVPNVSRSSFTVHLSKAVTTPANVAWFVVN